MSKHHSKTFDPHEEPEPRGGWFRLVDRPFPERLDRAFRVLAIMAAVLAAAATSWMIALYAQRPPTDLAGYAGAGTLVLIFAGMAYGFVRALGLILVAAYGTFRDGSEFVVDWSAVRHDAGLRRTWIVILEGALLLAAAGVVAAATDRSHQDRVETARNAAFDALEGLAEFLRTAQPSGRAKALIPQPGEPNYQPPEPV